MVQPIITSPSAREKEVSERAQDDGPSSYTYGEYLPHLFSPPLPSPRFPAWRFRTTGFLIGLCPLVTVVGSLPSCELHGTGQNRPPPTSRAGIEFLSGPSLPGKCPAMEDTRRRIFPSPCWIFDPISSATPVGQRGTGSLCETGCTSPVAFAGIPRCFPEQLGTFSPVFGLQL